MKYPLRISLALLLCSCQSDNASGQSHSLQSETTYPREKIVSNDRFDFDEFRKIRAKNFADYKREMENGDTIYQEKEEDFYPVSKTMPDGTEIVIRTPMKEDNHPLFNKILSYIIKDKIKHETKELKEGTYQVTITPPPPALFETVKYYRRNGIISSIMTHVYVGYTYSLSGITRTYDQNGVLEKTVNDDKRYDGMVNVDTLLQILIRNKLLDPYDDEGRKSYNIEFNEKRMIWKATHRKNPPFTLLR